MMTLGFREKTVFKGGNGMQNGLNLIEYLLSKKGSIKLRLTKHISNQTCFILLGVHKIDFSGGLQRILGCKICVVA